MSPLSTHFFIQIQSLWDNESSQIAFADTDTATQASTESSDSAAATVAAAELSVEQQQQDKRSEFEKQLDSLPKFDHIIVGGGVAAYEAAKAIQLTKPDATVRPCCATEIKPID